MSVIDWKHHSYVQDRRSSEARITWDGRMYGMMYYVSGPIYYRVVQAKITQ